MNKWNSAQTGWFVESLATQTLIIFVIRTRRVPFFRSVASSPVALAAVGITVIGAVLPYTGRLAHILGFQPLPGTFFFALAGIVAVYLVLVEIAKYWFYRTYHAPTAPTPRRRTAGYRVHRRAARFTIGHSLQPADGPNPDKAGRKRRTPTGVTGIAPDHAPGV